MKPSVTVGDKILVVVMIVVTLGSFFVMNLFASQGSIVIVELNGMAVYKGNLNEDRKVTVKGPYGDVRMQIKAGRVAVVYADCPNKVCMRTGWRSKAGESIVCVPNKVIVRVIGDEVSEVQGVTG